MHELSKTFGLRVLSVGAILSCAVLALLAQTAEASTQVAVQGTFIEVLESPQQSGCPEIAPAFNCGSGALVPFGHATEEIGFAGGCGGACDLRVIFVAGGALFLHERATSVSCPGACTSPPGSNGHPLRLELVDSVVRGTGVFAGATGTLTGIVRGSGPSAEVQLSGTLTLSG